MWSTSSAWPTMQLRTRQRPVDSSIIEHVKPGGAPVVRAGASCALTRRHCPLMQLLLTAFMQTLHICSF